MNGARSPSATAPLPPACPGSPTGQHCTHYVAACELDPHEYRFCCWCPKTEGRAVTFRPYHVVPDFAPVKGEGTHGLRAGNPMGQHEPAPKRAPLVDGDTVPAETVNAVLARMPAAKEKAS